MKRPRVLVTEYLDPSGLALLREQADLVYHDLLPPEELPGRLKEADAVIIRSAHRMTRPLLEGAPRLRVIARAGAGVDNIDLEAATEKGILVLNTPGANANAAAEHTFALLLSLVRHVRVADRHVREGGWNRQAFIGSELKGKTLGIIGIGRVGREVARIGRAFGMRILAYDPYVSGDVVRARNAEKVEGLEELLPQVDILTIHTPKTGPRLDGEIFRRLRRGAFVLNVARGGLVDEEALLGMMEAGHIQGAALDVFEQEPPVSKALLERDDVVVTCHLGGSTREAVATISERVARAVLQALAGEIPEEAVNLPFPDEPGAVDRNLLGVATSMGRLLAAVSPPGDRLTVSMGGPGADAALPVVSQAVLAGLLEGTFDTPVNMINAARRAEERGIHLRLIRENGSLPPSVTVFFEERPERAVEASLERTPRLRRVGRGRFDLAFPPHLLVTEHKDLPGVVGRVGSLLGEAGVNIGTLELDREGPGGRAVMVMGLDEAPSPGLLEAIAAFAEVERVYAVPLLTSPLPAAVEREVG